MDLLVKVYVQYVTLPGWKTSISNAKSFDDLPENCQKYIVFIETALKVNIEWIGVGPNRANMIKK